MGCDRLNTLLSVMLIIGGLVYRNPIGFRQLPSFYARACRRQASLLFPPNACRGERCGVWGRTAPIKPVRS